MKNPEDWKPSKFVQRGQRLFASRDKNEVAVYSRLVANTVAEFYARAISKFCKGHTIDLGCGKVPLYGFYSRYADNVTCADWPNSPHGDIHIDLSCDLSQPLPFSAQSFDTIILSDVLEHIAAPQVLWAEMARILRPDGVIIMNTPFFYWLHEEPFDFYRYTSHALKRFATDNELEVVSLEAIGGSVEIFIDFLSKHLYHLPVLGRQLTALAQSIGYRFSSSFAGKMIREKTSKKFPLGYAMVVRKSR